MDLLTKTLMEEGNPPIHGNCHLAFFELINGEAMARLRWSPARAERADTLSHPRDASDLDFYPEGPSTQYLRFLISQLIEGKALEPETLSSTRTL